MARIEIKKTTPLSQEDVTCPICLSLLLEPVTLPCHHSLCRSCFQEHVLVTSLFCPLCRTRISVWVRKNTKTNTLVDTKLWKAIQSNFPAQLEARLAGREDISGITQEVQQKVCEPGEIRQEYESFLEQETQETIKRKTKEEIASIKLIQQLQDEEKKRQEELQQQQQHVAQEDFLLALKLEVVEGRSPKTPTWSNAGSGSRTVSASPKGPMDLFLGQKGVIRGRHSPGFVLGSSDTNTMTSQDLTTPDTKESAIKHLHSHSSESESDEPSLSRHLSSAPDKENLKQGRRGSPMRPGEGSKGRRLGHSSAHRELQLSPDIDSFCVSTSLAKHQEGCGTSQASKEENSTEVEEEEIVAKEEDSSTADSLTDVSFLQKWENDKESLAALLSAQQHAEAQLQQELHDRRLAEALQEELNNQAKKVLRTKGSEDEYALRHRKKFTGHPQPQPGPSRKDCTKRQATLAEVFCKRHKSV